jgi:hypothetical protein
VPVSVGRSLRIVPERTRRLVLDRDRGCRFPGCVATAHLEVHHVVHWAHGGRTDLDNLVALCPFHHDAHHAGEFGIGGDANGPGGLVFTARGGFPIGPGPIYRPADRRQRPGALAPGAPGPAAGRVSDPGLDRRDGRLGGDRDPLDPGRDRPDPGPDRLEPRSDVELEPASDHERDPDDCPWPAGPPGVAYPGATGEVLQAKWVTFHAAEPVPI